MLSVLLAAPCAACGVVLDAPTRGCVCATCWARVTLITPPVCEHCGLPLASWRSLGGGHARVGLCARCRRRASAIDQARSAGLYEGALRDILHAFKYDARRSLAAPLAALVRQHAGVVLIGVDVVVPVPLHRARERARGFNQAEDLARAMATAPRLPVRRALRRVRATRTQADLPAAQRHRNVRDAFAIARDGALAGRRVLLVDDVSTTGATLEACARVLKAAGVREVRAVTVARVL